MLQLLFFSLDSFVAMAALGTLGVEASRRRALCLAFGFCDGLATFAGLHFHFGPLSERGNDPRVLAAMMCLWGSAVALLAYRLHTRGAVSLWQLTLLPLLLSLDNLFGGPLSPQIAAHASAAPLLSGLLSGALAYTGCQAGAQLSMRMPRRLALGLSTGALFLLPILA